MRFLVLAAALLASTAVFAGFEPEVVFTVKPVYPKTLTTTQGHARISLKIHNDGSVSDVKALNATKPAFGEAAVGAAKQWRFKPWTVSAERPAVVEARNDMLFSPEPISREGVQLNFTEVKFQSCRDLSEEVSQFRREHPTRPLSAMKSFAITRVAVMLPAFSGKTTYADGLVLADQLENLLPEIVRQCQANPTATYADYLPHSLKQYR
ncbi:TonB family protein [Pseudomonas sp. WS 5059]|jgi:TonB family protein|uniref:energy transducer TonB n=1 Tax=unclassified Pseudomonas TaxID=196821 RepID=UPI001473915D|nr:MULTISPECIES: TonB family protein [unclassified Pseudomonas]NMX67765.1 TonB family protein [Pseudomonas sp. WS 5111]NMX88455.1 TonB family protein [Pseudomonas sp. WS 5010]NMY03786.1 TonB family protein [Pseudomonas sp. WS 5059]NMY28447.1 TonB family protein [Pseudomonas sp. WS 5021]